MRDTLSDDRVWRRLLQPSTYPFDPRKLAASAITADPEVSGMHDLACLTEIAARAPSSVGLLLNDNQTHTSDSGEYWIDNVFASAMSPGRRTCSATPRRARSPASTTRSAPSSSASLP